MRVFVTGATGFIGSAIVRQLLGAGHQVKGLARSEEAALSLYAAGAQVHRGDLQDLDSLRSGAAAADGVIHTAFIHDFTKWKENCEIDRRAIEALAELLAGTGRTLIVTSGTALLSPGRVATEDQPPPSGPDALPRVASDEAAIAAASQGIRVALLRLPPTVHGAGDHGFVPMLVQLAHEKGVSAYVGDGANRWPAVHRLDAAHLYRLILESDAQETKAATYHAVAEEGVPFKSIAEAIGRGLHLPTVSIPSEEAAEHFGWFSHFAALDCPASSRQTRERLAWQPKAPELIPDLSETYYFKDFAKE